MGGGTEESLKTAGKAEQTGLEVPAGGVAVCALLLGGLVQDMVWKGLASLDSRSEGLPIEVKLTENDPPA